MEQKCHLVVHTLNYFFLLPIAYAAFECHQYIDCVIFCDIWCQDVATDQAPNYSIECLSKSLLDILYDQNTANGTREAIKMCQNLLADSYMALGEQDAIQGKFLCLNISRYFLETLELDQP